MPTPILRENQGSPIVAVATAVGTGFATIANNAYGAGIRVNNSTTAALLMDVWLTGSFAAVTAGAGALQLVVVPRDNAGNAGPTPSSYFPGKVYAFGPGTGNDTSVHVFSITAIPAPYDCDVYVLNNATGQTFTCTNNLQTSTAALVLQLWSPGT